MKIETVAWAWVVMVGLAAAGCEGGTEAVSSLGDDLISDQVHGGGSPGFFFLPPLVLDPGVPLGSLDTAAEPSIRIEALDNGEVLTTIGPGEIATTTEGFKATWDTRLTPVPAGEVARVFVLDGAAQLGFADVQIFATNKEARSLASDQIVPLVDGHKLHIRFWIEERTPACAPGAFEVPDNGIDDDCDGMIDVVAACDGALPSSPTDALDLARAIDLCPVVTEESGRWGVISAQLSRADGTGAPGAGAYSTRSSFGDVLGPHSGGAFALLSTGVAAGVGQTSPDYHDFAQSMEWGTASGYPADWLEARGGVLPAVPGCPVPPSSTPAQDAVMLTLRLRAPTNARSFSLVSTLYSSEFPEWLCSEYDDAFVVLIDSGWTGSPANPADKNLAALPTYTQCMNGSTSCLAGATGTITSCEGTSQLLGTGFDNPAPFECDSGSLVGGATGWRTIHGNVAGGEIVTLRIALWDTTDALLDSLVVLDDFRWSTEPAVPGTTQP